MRQKKATLMIKVVDIVYHCHTEYADPADVLKKHRPAFGFADFTDPLLDIQFIKHLNYTGVERIHEKTYAFFKSRNRFWWTPFRTHRYVRTQNPDIVIVEGLLFPVQLLFLKWSLRTRTLFVLRHHGEKPFTGLKGLFQKLADKYINAYLFTSHGNAADWTKTVIKNPEKCVELLEASTHFNRQDKSKSCAITGITGVYNFLWVGRLVTDKDPWTVLEAFDQYLLEQPDAKLYMIYQEELLLGDIKKRVMHSERLAKAVQFAGAVENKDLPYWYSASNFYITGSRREAAGYALLEAMACGCIPVITTIPSFKKITANGQYGFLYAPGDVESLANVLSGLTSIDIDSYRDKIALYFREHLSFKHIADEIYTICKQLHAVNL